MGSLKEVYCSLDVEADGKIPGDSSMLSFAFAAYTLQHGTKAFSTFSRNLVTLVGAKPDEDTMKWWSSTPEHKEAYEKTRLDIVYPLIAMREATEWVKNLPGKPVCVAYPAGFDYTWLHWYFVHFTGDDPFGFACLDLKTLVMRHLGKGYRECIKKAMPKNWFDKSLPHNHVALDDALGQGHMLMTIMAEYMATKNAQT